MLATALRAAVTGLALTATVFSSVSADASSRIADRLADDVRNDPDPHHTHRSPARPAAHQGRAAVGRRFRR